MKKIKCATTSAIIIGLEIYALFYGAKWAMHIFQFASPVFAACYFIIGVAIKESSKEAEKMLKTYRDGEHLPKWIDGIIYTFVIGAFSAYSHFWLAGCWMVICGVDFYLRDLASEKQT